MIEVNRFSQEREVAEFILSSAKEEKCICWIRNTVNEARAGYLRLKKFYENIVKDYKELFLYDDLWISYFLRFIKKNKILSLRDHLKKGSEGKHSLIYKTHILAKGLISIYGDNLIDSVKKRDRIAIESVKYMIEKSKNLKF